MLYAVCVLCVSVCKNQNHWQNEIAAANVRQDLEIRTDIQGLLPLLQMYDGRIRQN